MRESKVNKFSNGTLTRILENLDHMVKDYVLFKFNPGMEHRIWSKNDKKRSKEFIENIRSRKPTLKSALNDFEDLYLLHLQGKLNHLSGADKVHLFNSVNQWIRNIVIRKRVGDLQLKIESYQTKLNLTQPSWGVSDCQFKKDYTIFRKPMAVIYKDRNNQKKMMTETKVHKFSDGML
nr:hypothetical protein [Tanacetum cinerariifolium]